MHKISCWAFSTILILFLTVIGLCSNDSASGLISRMATEIESRQDQPSADAIIVSTAVAVKDIDEPLKSGDGNSPPGEAEKKEPELLGTTRRSPSPETSNHRTAEQREAWDPKDCSVQRSRRVWRVFAAPAWSASAADSLLPRTV
jgi:hypothetical protein